MKDKAAINLIIWLLLLLALGLIANHERRIQSLEKVFSPPNGSGVTRPSFSTDAPARFYYTGRAKQEMR